MVHYEALRPDMTSSTAAKWINPGKTKKFSLAIAQGITTSSIIHFSYISIYIWGVWEGQSRIWSLLSLLMCSMPPLDAYGIGNEASGLLLPGFMCPRSQRCLKKLDVKSLLLWLLSTLCLSISGWCGPPLQARLHPASSGSFERQPKVCGKLGSVWSGHRS